MRFFLKKSNQATRKFSQGFSRFFLAALLIASSVSVLLQIDVSSANATTVAWTSSTNVPAGNWYALAYGNGRWTAVAQSGTNRLMTSTDGVTWTTSGLTYNGAVGGPIDGDWRAVLYANNMWIAAGYDGRLMTSSDGLSWSNTSVTGLTINEDINALAYKTGLWVAVASNSVIVTSSDGLSWSSAGVTGVPASIVLRSVVWSSGRGKFFAVGDSTTVIYSSDGLTWSNASVTGIAASQSLTSIATGTASNGNLRFVIVAPSNTGGTVWSSTDGLSWSAGTANTNCTSSQRWNATGFGNGRWMAVRGAGGTCDSISSILGIQTSWEQTTGGTASWWNAVAYGNGRWVTVGSSIAMSSPEPYLTPTFDTPVATSDGFTVNVTNYSASYYWATAPTVSAGTATWGTAVGATRPLTVTGLSGATSATVTVTATRSGFAPGSATVSGTSLAPPATTTTLASTTTTTLPATTTTLPSTTTTTSTTVPVAPVSNNGSTTTTLAPRPVTVASPSPGQAPTLVTSSDATIASRQPGQVAAIVNGQNVSASVERITTPAVAVAPEKRSTEQVSAVQQAAASLVAEFTASLPQNATSPVSISNTSTGAVINGLLVNPQKSSTAIAVPVENVLMMTVGNVRLLLVGASPTGEPVSLKDGVLRVGPGGILSIALAGLPANSQGEAVLFSTPKLLGSFTTSADGAFSGQFTVPAGMESGAHSLLVKVGASTVSIGVRLDSSLTMPSTGLDVNSILMLAMVLLVAGFFSNLVSRRLVIS